MKVAYADPPYPGEVAAHYPGGSEVDHAALIAQLVREYPDGWALSTKEPSLHDLLTICAEAGARVRVMPWVKPFCSWKPGVGVAYSWEPVLVYGGRKRTRTQNTVRDWVSANITLQTGTHGAKPEAFCFWLFEVLNLQPGDELIDLFPGSGAVTRAWDRWRCQLLWEVPA